LRVSRYLTEDPHVRFSVWSADGVAEAAVSLEEEEAERLSSFLAAPSPPRRDWISRVLGSSRRP
jgi:dsDNA-binding SOS-regulon protein